MNEFIYGMNILVSIFGFISCFYILMNSTLNKQTAKCVISTCLAGLVWFLSFYSSLLNSYQANMLELLLKISLVFLICIWIDKNNIGVQCGLRRTSR